jgi:hypothetical protein
MPTHLHLIWELRMSGAISTYTPSGRARLPFCLPWFSAVINNFTVGPHSLIMRGMCTETLRGTVIRHTALPCPKAEYVGVAYLLPLPYRYRDSLWAGRSGDLIPVEARFSVPVQTRPGPYPASFSMGYLVFSEGKAAGV